MSYVSSIRHGLSDTSQTPLQPTPMYPNQLVSSQPYLPRIPSLPEAAYGASGHYTQQAQGLGSETSHYRIPQHPEPMRHPIPVGQHYFVDHFMNPHPYSALYPGFDINAVRRKNATRETTGPLKHWLMQHRKNPYPTKGDKIMLAIATRMTLTQVSTWFANARRRMKKDRVDNDDDEEEEQAADPNTSGSRERSGSLSSQVSLVSSDANTSKENDTSKEFDESELEDIDLNKRRAKKCVQRLFSPDIRDDHVTDPSSSPESVTGRLPVVPSGSNAPDSLPVSTPYFRPDSSVTCVVPPSMSLLCSMSSSSMNTQRQKIWSISEIIGSATKTISSGMGPLCNYVDSFQERFVSNAAKMPEGFPSTYSSAFSGVPPASTSTTTETPEEASPNASLLGNSSTSLSPIESVSTSLS